MFILTYALDLCIAACTGAAPHFFLFPPEKPRASRPGHGSGITWDVDCCPPRTSEQSTTTHPPSPPPFKRPASPCRAVVGVLRLAVPLSAGPLPCAHTHTHTCSTELWDFGCVSASVCALAWWDLFGWSIICPPFLFCVGMEPASVAVGREKRFLFVSRASYCRQPLR